MQNPFSAIKSMKFSATAFASFSALTIAVVTAGFYVADSITGSGTSLSKTLIAVGFCPDLEGPTIIVGPPGADGEVGTDGSAGLDGVDGVDGQDGAAGATGTSGTCSALNTASLAGNLVPSRDNYYSLGTSSMRWKSLQLGPGTLYIQDTETGQQAGITISDGTLLLDGVDGLRIGNVRFTSTGITSLLPGQDITIGSVGDLGWMSVAHGIKFADGTTQTTATVAGPAGPRGLTGASGPTGPQGPPGSIEMNGYVETKACMYTGRPNNTATGTLMIGSCAELGQEGKDVQILVKQ